jgi:hypothetical protein
MTAPTIPAGARLLGEDLAEWQAAINGKMTGGMKIKSVLTSRASTTTMTSDPHLTVAVAANQIYAVELEFNVDIGAGGFKHQSIAPSGSTFENISFAWNNGTVAFGPSWQRLAGSASPGAAVAGHAAGANGGTPYRLRYALFTGANPGTLALQWAQDSSNAANTTIQKGGWLRLMQST